MATVLQSDEIYDNGPYVIKGYYKGQQAETLLLMVPLCLGMSAYYFWKMPAPRTLSNTHDFLDWLLIAFFIALLIWTVVATVLRFNTEWVISQTGITRTRSSTLGQKEERWLVQSISRIDVMIIGFEKGTVAYFLSRSNAPTYSIRFYLYSGQKLYLKPVDSRDAAFRELTQIRKRLPDIPCEDFKADTGQAILGL